MTARRFSPVKAACENYGIGKTGIYELLGAGKIDAVKFGRKTLLVVASLERHFASLPKANIKLKPGKASGDSNSQASQPVENPDVTAEAPSAKASPGGDSKCLP
jgi:hypothetical protein